MYTFADAYVITNGETYIRRSATNQYIPTDKSEHATWWHDVEKAGNILRTLPKILRTRGYYVDKMPESLRESLVKIDAPTEEEIKQAEDKPSDFAVTLGASAALATCGVQEVEDMYREVMSMVSVIERLAQMQKTCGERIEEQQKIQEDLLHRVEFETGNCSAGWKLFSALRACRKTRRAYKDLSILLSSLHMDTLGALVKQGADQCEAALSARLYRPRSNAVFTQGEVC